ncbi:DUF1214 domain-containing protein [Kitasatospora griseola]|uniref:DUF1214 domain-containing protein n=1 Tax=Kitasatospora griseola TaxID=2064 RepID=UPI0037F68ACA
MGDRHRRGAGRLHPHFPTGQLSSVDASWSLTAYDASSFPVENPENIYAIGRLAPPAAEPETGATTLYVQAEVPADSETATADRPPVPTSGTFSVTLRRYAPQTDDILADRPSALTPVPAQD